MATHHIPATDQTVHWGFFSRLLAPLIDRDEITRLDLGQADYGDGPMVRHPDTGKYRRTRLFVFTLATAARASAC